MKFFLLARMRCEKEGEKETTTEKLCASANV